MNEQKIITRAEWGAPSNRRLILDPTPEDDRLICHTIAGGIGYENNTLAQDIARMRSIDRFHFSNRGWAGGVGYQHVIMQSGRIFEGRGWLYLGGHTVGLNSEHGFAFDGHGDKAPATPAQWESARSLVRQTIRAGYLDDDYLISGHRDHIIPGSKSCPGNLIYPYIRTELSPKRVWATQQEDDFPMYSEWPQAEKDLMMKDVRDTVRKAILYPLTGSQPSRPDDDDEWNNLSDLSNEIGTIQAHFNIEKAE